MSGIGAIGAIGTNPYSPYGFYSARLVPTENRPSMDKIQGIGSVKGEEKSLAVEKAEKKAGIEKCETCATRKYQDGSNENVSFKAASHVSPEAAGAAVRAHEGEHVANAYDKAAQKGGKVMQASVAIHTAVCPECGRTYVSGGTTTTRISYPNESNPYQKALKARDAAAFKGMNFDAAV